MRGAREWDHFRRFHAQLFSSCGAAAAFVWCAHFFPPSREILETMAVDPVGDDPSPLKIDSRPSVRVAVCSVGKTLLTAGQSGSGKNC